MRVETLRAMRDLIYQMQFGDLVYRRPKYKKAIAALDTEIAEAESAEDTKDGDDSCNSPTCPRCK